MDNSPGVAVVDSIAQLIDEQFDLVGCEGVFVFAEIFL